MDNRVGGGVSISRIQTIMKFRLQNQCGTIQVKIKTAAIWLRYYRIYSIDIQICTDSKAAMKFLTDVYTAPRFVHEYSASFDEIIRHSHVELL